MAREGSYGSDEIGYRFWDSKSHKVVRSRDVTFNEDSLYEAKAATDSNTSEGSENSGSFEDSGRSDEEDSEDRASSEEGGSETLRLRRSTRESRAPVRVKEEQDGKKSCEDDYKSGLVLSIVGRRRAGYKRCAMDHCLAKQIIGMSIIRDRTKGTLRLSQERYIGKVLEKFNMKDAEARCQSLGDHFKLNKQAPKTEASRRIMAKIHVKPKKGHWEAVKLAVTLLERSPIQTMEKCVAMSTTEAEYMAIAKAGKELKIFGGKEHADMSHQCGDNKEVEALRIFN
ncbi:hypothetical protein Tco_1252516 [Tanacetum coccineum]